MSAGRTSLAGCFTPGCPEAGFPKLAVLLVGVE
jgi:hypothetical protein